MEGHLELVTYDERTKTSTVKLTDVELVDLNELVTGILATRQDYAILGVQRERLEEIKTELSSLLGKRLSHRAGVNA